jgi:PEP-CTERM motif
VAIGDQLKEGMNASAGYWNGSAGIVSSSAAADTRLLTTLGYGPGGAVFEGANTVSTDMLVKYTYYGDADLNGTVNGADYQQIDKGFGMHLTGWSNGDFNYDNTVDGSDYSLIDNTFNELNASAAIPLAIVANSASMIGGLASVPEPGSLSILALCVAGFMGQRRRGAFVR